MLFVSKLTLGYKDLQINRISDEYGIHRVIYSLFEDLRNSEEKGTSLQSGFLYAEQKRKDWGRQFLILSDRKPLECSLIDGSIITKTVHENFLNFKHYRFQVLINPTIRDNTSGKLRPILGKSHIEQWFVEKSTQSWGFSASNVIVNSVDVLKFKGKKGNMLTIARADISGTLTVNNFELFKKAFSKGIGRAHAFGCGLLQITPIEQ